MPAVYFDDNAQLITEEGMFTNDVIDEVEIWDENYYYSDQNIEQQTMIEEEESSQGQESLLLSDLRIWLCENNIPQSKFDSLKNVISKYVDVNVV